MVSNKVKYNYTRLLLKNIIIKKSASLWCLNIVPFFSAMLYHHNMSQKHNELSNILELFFIIQS